MNVLADMANRLATRFVNQLSLTTPTVFLAGRRPGPGALRVQLRRALMGQKRVQRYDVLYPEDLFGELVGKKPGLDLLSLENTLATHANATIILLEGPGSIAELGAFTNNPELRRKLVVVVDKRYRRDRSFIMLGPVALLRSCRSEAVIMHNLSKPDPEVLATDVRRAVRLIMQDTRVDQTLNNPIRTQYLFLAATYLLGAATLATLQSLLAYTGDCQELQTTIVSRIAVNILMRRQEVAKRGRTYHLTTTGLERVRGILDASPTGYKFTRLFDECRLDILTATRRVPGSAA
ncbi:MAG: retron St85 family effector protein [Bacteroidota bacterium]|mgnify:CR=1 FL=1